MPCLGQKGLQFDDERMVKDGQYFLFVSNMLNLFQPNHFALFKNFEHVGVGVPVFHFN